MGDLKEAKEISKEVLDYTDFNRKGKFELSTNYSHRTLKRAVVLPYARDKSILTTCEFPNMKIEGESKNEIRTVFTTENKKQIRIKIKHKNPEETNTAIEYYIQGPTIEHEDIK